MNKKAAKEGRRPKNEHTIAADYFSR